jgi:hypothetical protein
MAVGCHGHPKKKKKLLEYSWIFFIKLQMYVIYNSLGVRGSTLKVSWADKSSA